MSKNQIPPTYWEIVSLLATGFFLGTACDMRRIGQALIELADAILELGTSLFKLVTRWMTILIGPISFPLLAWWVLHVYRKNEAKKAAEKKEALERAFQTWGVDSDA